MKILKRGLTGLLVLIFLSLNLPKGAFCEGSSPFPKAGQKTITRHEPKIMATPEKDIPMVPVGEKDKKGKTHHYLWLGLGAAVVLGLVAAGGGGGGGGGGGDTPTQTTGNISVGW
jgi:hypothetical protein